MEKEDEVLHIYFMHISQLCFEKAKEHIVSNNTKKCISIIPLFLGERKRAKVNSYSMEYIIKCFTTIGFSREKLYRYRISAK